MKTILDARYQMRALKRSCAQRGVWVGMLIDSAIKSNKANISLSLVADYRTAFLIGSS